MIVHTRGQAMDRADEGSFTAADHSQAHARFRTFPAAAFDRHVLFPFWLRANAEHAPVGLQIRATRGEIVERLLGHADDVVADEDCALARPFLRILDAAFPLEHGPTLETVLGELGEDRAEIHLPIAERTEADCPVDPGLEPAIDAGA